MTPAKILLQIGTLSLILMGDSPCVQAANLTAVNEVTKLKNAGLSDDTIVGYINSKNFNYDLSADDIVALQQQGISQTVLNAMLASGRNNEAPTGAAPVAQPPIALIASSTPSTPTPALGPDVDYFYQQLSPYGQWLMAEDGQWYWQPNIIATTPTWRPYYNNGYWTYTDAGWYWTSDYPWAWAVFHYGRWRLDPRFGWIWRPDRVWGPAWVTWRSGGDYCGWATLPPGAVFNVAAGRFMYHGTYVAVGFDFGLNWTQFSFCYTRELGQPFHWHPSGDREIHSIYNHTTVIANYRVGKSMINGESRQHFVNVGVEPARVAELRGRPVETMKLQDLGGTHEKVAPQEQPSMAHRSDSGRHEDNRRDEGR